VAAEFDPYYKWLGIPPAEQPPNHYRLLGLGLFEDNPDVIETAADRQMRHVQTFKTSQHSAASQKVLNELSQARLCLLRPDLKAAYDRQLQAEVAAKAAPVAAAAALPLRKAVALEEPEIPAIIPNEFVPPVGAGTAPPIGAIKPSRRTPPWLLAAGGGMAVCLAVAAAVVVWRLQPITPELAALPDQVVDEGQPVELTLQVTNPKAAAQALEYFLVEGAPPGSRIDRRTGKFTWTPSEEQGPGKYQATLRAAVAGSPSVFHQQTVRITVNEVAQAPLLDPVDVRHLSQRNGVLTLQLKARDRDVPPSTLRYSVSMEPAVASSPEVDDQGLFRWKPASADLGKPYQITFKVAKASNESLVAQDTMTVTLKAATPPPPAVVSTPQPMPPTTPTTTPAPTPTPTPTPDPAPPATATPAASQTTATVQKKAAIPETDAQKKAADKIEMIFREQLASRKPEDRRSLARDLLRQAPGTTELAERYVMLLKARDLAVGANDVAMAWEAIDAANQDFEVEALEQKIDALKKGTGVTRTPAEAHDHIQRSIALIEQALRDEKFDLAQPLVQPATASAAKLKDAALVTRVRDLGKDIKDQKKEFEAVETARETLQESPDDPAANFAVGKYQCLSRDKWSEGLPLLVKSDNEKWAEAAKTDLANPTEPAAQVAAGDAWWSLADAAKTAEKLPLQMRAAHWYRQALPTLTGLDKVKLEKKLEKLPAATSTASVPRPLPVVPPGGNSRTQPVPALIPQPEDLKKERKIAENFLKANQGYLNLQVEGQQQQVHVNREADIPAANFVIQGLGILRAPTDEELSVIKDLKFIESISVLSGRQVSASGIAQMQSLASLKHVSLSYVPVTDAQLAEFRRLPKLEHLYVRHGEFSGSGLGSLSSLPKLSRLEVSSSMLTDDVFEAAARLPALDHLSVEGSNIRGTGLAALRSCRTLTSLILKCPGIDEANMASLATAPVLSVLHLEGGFSDATLAHIARIPNLRHLHWGAGSFTAAGMKALSASRSLGSLALASDPLTDEAIKSLPSLGRLQNLNIMNGRQLTNQGLEPLTRMAFVESVMLQNAGAITNDGVAHLAKIPGVQTIYVSGAQGITDAGLQHFKGRQQIRRVSFYNSQVTDAGVAALKQLLPNCDVHK
jgi:hypothetical protein